MITKETFFGGASERAISSDLELTSGSLRLQHVDVSAGGLSVILPNATQMQTGAPIFFIFNVDAVLSFDIEDNDNNVLATVASDEVATIYLFNNSTAAGVWGIRITAFESA